MRIDWSPRVPAAIEWFLAGQRRTIVQIVSDFATAMHAVDARRPVAARGRGEGVFQPGIGPHSEDEAVRLCIEELARREGPRYGAHARAVPYGPDVRARCDLCLGSAPNWTWAIEAKLLRFLGDNGKPNGHMLMHILSPYSQDHSALTDCVKLAGSALLGKKAILIFGYHHEQWPLEPAIEAFEVLADRRCEIGPRHVATTDALVHPVHGLGRVFAWELGVVRCAGG